MRSTKLSRRQELTNRLGAVDRLLYRNRDNPAKRVEYKRERMLIFAERGPSKAYRGRPERDLIFDIDESDGQSITFVRVQKKTDSADTD